MNPYKAYKRFFQWLLWGVTLLLIIALVGPIVTYHRKPYEEMSIAINAKENGSSLNWIMNNEKISNVLEERKKLIFVDNEADFDKSLMDAITDNLFIGEMLYSQFGGNQQKHDYLNNLFGDVYLGYVGKTCEDLSNREDVPEAMITLYEVTTGEKWSYYGKGIVFSDGKNVLVLEGGKDYSDQLVLSTDAGNFIYNGYFELIEITPSTSATFQLELTESGHDALPFTKSEGVFSAELRVSNRVFDGIYHCGAFSKTPVMVPSTYNTMATLMQNKLIYDNDVNEKLYWKWYYPAIKEAIYFERDTSSYFANNETDENLFYADQQSIFINDKGASSPFFLKGVNLGVALPGKTFTEFPMDKMVYKKWLSQMVELNINTLRVYTLLPPSFYQALHEFNENRDQPIYLLQEIWPEEYPEDHNYLGQAYNESYRQEIEYTIHAIHGNINVPVRNFRAYGIYSYDVSPYLIGYLVGREMEPLEVQATDALNEGYEFRGQYLYAVGQATATEAWLAESCDYALAVEELYYGDKPLVGIVSWPTLDPLDHDSEWSTETGKLRKFNDNTVVDINHIGIHEENVTGFFGAYHIYPNYPDFMNNELVYNSYEDQEGIFRYGGYLKEFMEGHKRYPAVVAEYGIATSQVTAHHNPDGYDHGGLSESEQGEGIIRMTEAIIREGYSGAIVFEWMDEWTKKTWTTEPYMIPYNKNQYWHNVLDPEQNYGLLANESMPPVMMAEKNGKEGIRMGQNAAYLTFEIEDNLFEKKDGKIQLAIDTVDNRKTANASIAEFLLSIGSSSDLRVNPSYNWVEGHYQAVDTGFENYELMIQLTNSQNISKTGEVTLEKRVNLSALTYGDFSDPGNNISFDGSKWTVRLPYGLIAMSDPTDNRVLSDSQVLQPLDRDQIATVEIDSIRVIDLSEETDNIYEFPLEKWSEPIYRERYKKGFTALSDYFNSLNE